LDSNLEKINLARNLESMCYSALRAIGGFRLLQWPLLDEDHRERFWLVYVTFLVGSYLFTASCAIMAVLAINQDWEARMTDWKISGGSKPR
jgi:hypothetical protein